MGNLIAVYASSIPSWLQFDLVYPWGYRIFWQTFRPSYGLEISMSLSHQRKSLILFDVWLNCQVQNNPFKNGIIGLKIATCIQPQEPLRSMALLINANQAINLNGQQKSGNQWQCPWRPGIECSSVQSANRICRTRSSERF